jgi:hypothetical protein
MRNWKQSALVPFRYSNPDCHIVCRENNKVTRVEGVDYYALYDCSPAEVALRRMVSIATESTFFAILDRGTRRQEYSGGTLCETLSLGNVGIIVMIDGALKVGSRIVGVSGANTIKPIAATRSGAETHLASEQMITE